MTSGMSRFAAGEHRQAREIILIGLLGLALTCGCVSPASANCNPLNLPTPHDPGRPGTVVLHGGGRFSDEILEKFIALAGGKKAEDRADSLGDLRPGQKRTALAFLKRKARSRPA